MGKKIRGMFLLAAAAAVLAAPGKARADELPGGDGWKVVFTPEEEMESNFKNKDVTEAVSGLQPGDSVTFHVALQNEHSATTNWYMTNEVLYSLEDRSANSATGGGAYTYTLTYTGPDGEEDVLFDSDTVGGDEASAAREGLHEATDALEDYFYLDTLASGEGGEVRLSVALDGETQGNDYQDTLADLQMNFAVELAEEETQSASPTPTAASTTNNTTSTPTPRATQAPADENSRATVVRTSDDTNIIPILVVMAACGIVILAIARRSWNRIHGKGKGGSEE